MPIRFVCVFLIAVALTTMHPIASAAPGSSTAARHDAFTALLTRLREAAHARDSLSTIVDSTTGASREFIEEQISQQDKEIHTGVLAAVERIKQEQTRGADVSEERRLFGDEVREDWPRRLAQLQRRAQWLASLGMASDAASGAERLAMESELSQESDRLLESYRYVVDAILALEGVGIDVSEQRRFLVDGIPTAARGMVTRVQLANRARSSAVARLSRDGSNAELRYALDSAEERLKRATHSLSTVISLMNRLRLETTDLRVALIASTGKITADVFRWKVFLALMTTLWDRLLEFLASKAPQWLFQGGLIILTFLGFRALSRLVRYVVSRAVQHYRTSQLMRRTIIRLSANAVMLVGFVVILTQIGVQVAPLLAGFGIAGVVVGFAMQSTLANFAAGGMILGNRPFDLGDEIEVAGVIGVVKRMSLVSTTILTADNQTLIIPNSNVWGGVIRNRTAQPIRRVDLKFSIGYGDDIEKAELVLRDTVVAQENVLKDPAPVIKLHQLADSSVDFVVRAWTSKDRYWDVYWDLTRAVKLRFDQEGITIPFPQRDLHVKVDKVSAESAVAVLGATTGDS